MRHGALGLTADGFYTEASFRVFCATATLRQAEESIYLTEEQFRAFKNAWLLSAPHFAGVYASGRSRLSRMIAECAL